MTDPLYLPSPSFEKKMRRERAKNAWLRKALDQIAAAKPQSSQSKDQEAQDH